MDFLDTMVNQLTSQDLSPRKLAGAAGLLLLLFGSRLYRLAIIAPGVIAGVWVGSQAGDVTSGLFGTRGELVVSVVLGIGGGVLAHLLERFAVAMAGALLFGFLAQAAAPLVLGASVPWYLPAVGALLGLALASTVYERFLPVVTAALGALALAWSMGREQDLVFVGLVAGVGLTLQLLLGRLSSRDSSSKARA